jgi:glyoxylase-like metal-dependent hydrolase (beta-lactamase superfamily II)
MTINNPRLMIIRCLVIAALFPGKAFSQADPASTNYYIADSLLNLAAKALAQSPTALTLSGTEYRQGHFPAPDQLDTCPLKAGIANPAGPGPFTETFMIRYRNHEYSSSVVFTEDSCRFTDYGDTASMRLPLGKACLEYFYLPGNIILLARKFKNTLKLLHQDNRHVYLLAFNDAAGKNYYLYIDKTRFTLDKVEELTYDAMAGDTDNELYFTGYRTENGALFPSSILHKRNGYPYRNLKADSITWPSSAASAPVPAAAPPAPPAPTAGPAIEMDTLAAHIFLLKMLKYNNKVLLTTHDGYLSVYEAPVGLAACREIIRFINEKFPDLPIRYCFVSHHHPDHAGGIAAFADIGATIVTTTGNKAYFERLIRARHSRNPSFPEYNGSGGPFRFLMVDDSSSWRLTDTACPVIAFETGSKTSHTNEYLLFYFPQQKLLFEGDLVLFPQSGVLAQGKRAYAVYDLISAKGLQVDKIVPSWPLYRYKDEATLEDLKMALKKNYPGL